MEMDLNLRLNSIQNQILDLYELNSNHLDDHITLWNLIRKENALFFAARQRGLTSLGGQTLPSSASSQSSAKDAIKQVLYLQSLKESRYGGEPWTLQETSKERLNTEPQYRFKKNGVQVDVTFDNDPENVARYVLWTLIYFQDANDQWVKTTGRVDHSGLYYVDEEGDRIYYIDFAEEAMKFSNTAYWTVTHNGALILPDSGSATSQPADSTTSEEASLPDSAEVQFQHPSTSTSSRLKERPRKVARETRRRGGRTSTPIQPKRPQGQRGGGEGEGGRRRGRLRLGGSRVTGRPQRRGGSGRTQRSQRPDINLASTGTSGRRAPSPDEVGTSTKTPQGRGRSRLDRLLQEARDPPFLGLKGENNTLKCVRYRLKGQYGSYFEKVTTTWQWTSSTGNDRCGEGRILILFKDEQQRALFLDKVKLPKSVALFAGSAVGI